MADLPTGTVTFLFTDIEGSTRLLQQLGEGYAAVQDRHAEIMRAAIHQEGGHEVRTEGDSFFVAFRTPIQGIRAAITAQRGLSAEPWAHGDPLRVRMGLHTGDGVLGGDDYVGIDVNLAARIAAAGHGGQVLLSAATWALVRHSLPEGIGARELGRHRLKDIDHPEDLYDLIIKGLPADFPRIRSLEGPRTNLPPERTSFIGREHEIAEIGELLTRTRLVTLTGPGGTGKTRLALRVAAGMLGRFEGGAMLIDLTGIADPALVPSKLATALGIREDPAADPVDTVAGHVADQEILLVLDNLEQVVEASPALGRLLDAAPRLRILATSRVPLHLSGEHEYPIEPLPLPARDGDPHRVAGSESVTLFVERATAANPRFRLDEANTASIADIVRRVDGLPLAIELAASQVKALGLQTLVDRLELRLPLLAGGPRDAPERHRTLRSAIDWSHDLLDEDERRLFARLSVFRGGCTIQSAEAVCGPGLELPVIGALGALVEQSLVRRDESRDGDVRFQMLETILEYAAERLAASGELDEMRRRHAEHFRDLAEEAEPHLMGEGQFQWTKRLETEHDNIRIALDHAEMGGDVETALRTAAAIWRFWQFRAHLVEARARLDRLLALPGAEARGPVRVRALGALGGIAYWQNDYEACGPIYEEAAEIAREVGDRRLLSRALFDLSFVPLLTTQDWDRSEQLLRESLALAADDDRVLLAQTWTGLGYVLAWQGDMAAAISPIENALAIHREMGDRVFTAENLIGLGGLRLVTGDAQAARELLAEAVGLLAEPGGPVPLSQAILARAVLAHHDADHVRAARLVGAWARAKEEGGGSPPPMALIVFGDPEAGARAALGDARFERARDEGYAMSPDQAWTYVQDEGTSPTLTER